MILIPALAIGAPFLTCDVPTEDQQVTSYEIFQDGVSLGTTPAPMNFDLQGVVPGAYDFTATAINVWGQSSPSNPYISPASAAPPLNIKALP